MRLSARRRVGVSAEPTVCILTRAGANDACVAHELALLLRQRDAPVSVVRDVSGVAKVARDADAIDVAELIAAGVSVLDAADLEASIKTASAGAAEWFVVDALSRSAEDVTDCVGAAAGCALYALLSSADVYAPDENGVEVDEAEALRSDGEESETNRVAAERALARAAPPGEHGWLVFRGAFYVAKRGCLAAYAALEDPLVYFFRRVECGRAVPLPWCARPRQLGDAGAALQRVSLVRAADAAAVIDAALRRPAAAAEQRVFHLAGNVCADSLAPPTYAEVARASARAARADRVKTPLYATFGDGAADWSRRLSFPFPDRPFVLSPNNTAADLLEPLGLGPQQTAEAPRPWGIGQLKRNLKLELEVAAAAQDARLMAAFSEAYDAYKPFSPNDEPPAPVDPTQFAAFIDPTSPYAADDSLIQKGLAQRGSVLYVNDKIHFPLGPSRNQLENPTAKAQADKLW